VTENQKFTRKKAKSIEFDSIGWFISDAKDADITSDVRMQHRI